MLKLRSEDSIKQRRPGYLPKKSAARSLLYVPSFRAVFGVISSQIHLHFDQIVLWKSEPERFICIEDHQPAISPGSGV